MPPFSLTVQASAGNYDVLIGDGLLEDAGNTLHARDFPRRCAVVTDRNVEALYGTATLSSLKAAGFKPTLISVEPGESSKSMEQAGAICDRMIEAGLDRRAFLLALGGGVVGDLGGFAASVFYRGIPVVQAPTTLLAQVDSAIGGKTGVNSALGKNLIGAFHPPALVLADTGTLRTLPKRVLHEGMAEVIKHGIIRDRELFNRIESRTKHDLPWVVQRNLEIKASIVSEDEFERKGVRALLNFGHTIGHGIEQAAGYGALLHGEAISLGMIAATRLSVEKARLSAGDCQRVIDLLASFDLPTKLPASIPTETVLASLAHDKKFEDGAIRFVLATSIGSARLSAAGEVTAADLARAVAELR